MPFNRVFTDAQRLAVQQAYCDKGIRPHRRISELAAEGALRADGEPVEPFRIDHRTVGQLGRQEARRRAGEQGSTLVSRPPMDAVDVLRRRLLAVADSGLQQLERASSQKRVDVEYLQKLTRVARELAALSRATSTPIAPGERDQEVRRDRPTKLASQALAALRVRGDDADTANVHGPEAMESEGIAEREEGAEDGWQQGGSAGAAGAAARPAQSEPTGLAEELRQQLYS